MIDAYENNLRKTRSKIFKTIMDGSESLLQIKDSEESNFKRLRRFQCSDEDEENDDPQEKNYQKKAPTRSTRSGPKPKASNKKVKLNEPTLTNNIPDKYLKSQIKEEDRGINHNNNIQEQYDSLSDIEINLETDSLLSNQAKNWQKSKISSPARVIYKSVARTQKKSTSDKYTQTAPPLQKKDAHIHTPVPYSYQENPLGDDKKGSFLLGDVPEKITKAVMGTKDFINVEVEWKPRKNGCKPEKTIITNEEMKWYQPEMLCSYYETKLSVKK